MAVMEVELPSGYVADVEALPSITRAKEIKRIDTAKGGTNVVIYFDRVSLIYNIY
jgi:CD109 antigen